jgi:hypothetical protein
MSAQIKFQDLLTALKEAHNTFKANPDKYDNAEIRGMADIVRQYFQSYEKRTLPKSALPDRVTTFNKFITAINSVQPGPGAGNDDESVQPGPGAGNDDESVQPGPGAGNDIESVYSGSAFSTDIRKNMYCPTILRGKRTLSEASEVSVLSELTRTLSDQSLGSFSFDISRQNSAGSVGGYDTPPTSPRIKRAAFSPATTGAILDYRRFLEGSSPRIFGDSLPFMQDTPRFVEDSPR